MKTTDPIAEALDLATEEDINNTIPVVVQETDDYDFARKNLRELLTKGNTALEEMLGLAKLSQHPRLYEGISVMISTLSGANKDLLELAEQKKRITEDVKKPIGATNNNLYIGSTEELLKLIKGKKE